MFETRAAIVAAGALGFAVCALSCAAPALGQDQPQPPPAEAGRPPAPAFTDDELAAFLAKRIKESEDQLARLREAATMLEQGAPRDRVLEKIRPAGSPGSWRWPGRPEAAADPGPRGGQPQPGPDAAKPGKPPDRELTEAEIDSVLDFVREHLPSVWKRAEAAMADNPESVRHIARRYGWRVMEVLAAREHDPEMGDLKTRELVNGVAVMDAVWALRQAHKAAQADPSAAGGEATAAGSLRDRLGEQFDIRAALHALQITRLRAEIDRLQAEATRDAAQREAIIDRWLADRVREAQQQRPPTRPDPGGGPGPGPAGDRPPPPEGGV